MKQKRTFIVIFITFLILLGLLFYFISSLGLGLSSPQYSGISAISTSIAAIGGLLLLLVTYLGYNESRLQRLAQEEPAVSVRLIPHHKNINFYYWVIKNTGNSPAYDINIKIIPDIEYKGTTINKLNIFNRLPILEKGEEISFFYNSVVNYLESDNPKLVKAYITYFTAPKESKGARKITRDFDIDFEERLGLLYLGKKDMNDLVKEIEELKQALILNAMRNKND
ncbi:hypothetical protein CJ481_17705 [Bacillus subtilis]|nr:hypothetical protein CJ481_17705 [Bacillus subtilis]